MFCPMCRYEYRDGIETCPTCETDLVHLLPDLPAKERKPLLPYAALAAIVAVVMLYSIRTLSTLDPAFIDAEMEALGTHLIMFLTRIALIGFFAFLLIEWPPARSGPIKVVAGVLIGYHALLAFMAAHNFLILVGIDIWPDLTQYVYQNPRFGSGMFAISWPLILLFYAVIGFSDKSAAIAPSIRAGALLACGGAALMLVWSSVTLIMGIAHVYQSLMMLPFALFGVFTEAYFFSRFLWPVTVEAEEPPVSATV